MTDIVFSPSELTTPLPMQRSNPARRIFCHFWVASLWLTSLVLAEVYQSDDFQYPKGPIEGMNEGTGWNGPWEVSGSGNAIANGFNLSDNLPAGYTLVVEPNTLQLTPVEKSLRVTRVFSPAIELNPSSPRTYYFSFVFCRVDTSNQNGSEVFSFGFSGGGNRIVTFDTTSSEQLQINYLPTKDVVTGDKEVIKFTEGVKTSPRYIFVGRITANPAGKPDTFDFSVFDASSSLAEEPQTWDISMSMDASESLDALDIIAAPFLRTILIDNLRIGSDFSSVVRP